MRAYLIAACVAVLLCSPGMARADAAQANSTDIEGVLKTLDDSQATEHPRFLKTPEGFFRYLASPPGTYFSTDTGISKSNDAETAARQFLSNHGGAFGVVSPRGAYTTKRVKTVEGRTYVRLQQTYNGIDVFGAEMNFQLNASNGITSILSDILRDTTPLDDGDVSISPAVALNDAANKAIAWAATTYQVDASNLDAAVPDRLIYDPKVMGLTGSVTVVWVTVVSSAGQKPVKEKVFVDGHSGEVIFHYSLIMESRDRLIYDADNTFVRLGTLVRTEGDSECGIEDADNAYDYLGDIYDFYYSVHERDSIDGLGLTLSATSRWCTYYSCPLANAFYVSKDDVDEDNPYYAPDHMYFGEGYAVDDVTAHELTHGVTAYESNLVYAYQPGAINEAFSDIWGEFVDLTNGKGTDTEAVKWLMGEDLPDGAGRSMADPPLYYCPDRVGSDYYYSGSADSGGVHINSGVINKLCYLLTQGDTFNGRTVQPLDTNFNTSLKKAAKLFYEMQTNLLTSTSDFDDFYLQLGQAAVNLGYSYSERLNIQTAAKAVEIATETEEDKIGLFRAIPATDTSGRSVIALYWANPESDNFRQAILVRSIDGFVEDPADGTELYRGMAEKFLDTAVTSGVEYFYTLFADSSAGFPSMAFAKATAGGAPEDYLSEAFSSSSPCDLAFKQILFSPTGAPVADIGASGVSGYSAYSVTVKDNVTSLPVEQEDEDGAAFNLNLLDDGYVTANLSVPFPFFGKLYRQLVLASNGYITFESFRMYGEDNFPSLASHFSSPRISFLFSDLDPSGGGEVWARFMDDRSVLTFLNVHEYAATASGFEPNTVQVELFYSGHIRITYLGLMAENVVVGLSDGLGVPVDPATLFSNVRSLSVTTDLTDFSSSSTALTFEPVPMQIVEAGQTIEFSVTTNVPAGLTAPALTAEWDGPITVPFVDYGNGTGKFRWTTDVSDSGTFTVRIRAQRGTLEAYQDVALWVGVTTALPIASDLRLRTTNTIEDPTRNRVIPPETNLTAEYDYSHSLELEDPLTYGEGETIIMWFRNNQLVSTLNNQTTVPAGFLRSGQTWFFTVTPVTLGGLTGMTQQSPFVTVAALPLVLNVALPADLPADVDSADLPLEGLPAAAGPSTGGTTVVLLGSRFTDVLSVTFGGIEAESFNVVDDYWIEAVTPAHTPSLVVGGEVIAEDVVVTTATGTGLLRNAYTFTDSGTTVDKADINGDGRVDAIDIQIVINTVLAKSTSGLNADANRDGHVNAADIQVVINGALMQI